MSGRGCLIVLDRDGVLNRVFGDPASGHVQSPLVPSEVELFPWVAHAVFTLTHAGFTLAVATNQPGWAKGQTTRADLDEVQARVLSQARSQGGVIANAFVCFHRAEDGCVCRKPRPGMLEQALAAHPKCRAADAWMVGDRATDIVAGAAAGMKTALLGPPVAGDRELLERHQLNPSFRGADLRDFVKLVVPNQGAL